MMREEWTDARLHMSTQVLLVGLLFPQSDEPPPPPPPPA
jgi:hypothetical protein